MLPAYVLHAACERDLTVGSLIAQKEATTCAVPSAALFLSLDTEGGGRIVSPALLSPLFSVHEVYWPGATPRLLAATPHLFSSLRSAGHSPSLSLSPSSHAYISYHHHQCVPFYHHHLRLTTREQWAKNRLRLCHFRCRQRWKFSNSWLYYTSNAFFCLTCIM